MTKHFFRLGIFLTVKMQAKRVKLLGKSKRLSFSPEAAKLEPFQ
jgi:hypothetical protein